MFIRYRYLTKILVLSVIALVVLLPCYVYASQNVLEFKTVVIDAGHGGIDGGVVSSDGVKESDINLAIAKKLQSQLEDEGVRVIMTRSDEGAIASSKKKDMNRRREIIKNAHADLVISIHTNKFSDSRRRGAQVFFDDTKKWQREAYIMQNVLNEYINKKYCNRSDIVALSGDFFITKCADVPSIIVETLFISNSEDKQLLTNSEFQMEISKVIKDGALSILTY